MGQWALVASWGCLAFCALAWIAQARREREIRRLLHELGIAAETVTHVARVRQISEAFDRDMREAVALIDYGASEEAIEMLEKWRLP